MSIVPEEVERYSEAHTTPPAEALRALDAETRATQTSPQMLTGPVEGRLLCCDVSTEWTSIGRGYWESAGVADVIDLRIAPALDTLRSLPPDPVVDLAFVDADKGGYTDYYEALVPKLSERGLIVADNTLHGGGALEGDVMHDFNEHVMADPRTACVLLPVRDGVTLIRLA